MNIYNKTIVLKDENDDIKDKIVVYDNPIDFNLFIKDLDNLRKSKEWTYDDLIKLLDSYGSYTLYDYSEFITLYY